MRLTRSLALWLTGTTALILGLHGWIQVRQERADLFDAASNELVLLTTAIRTAVENALRDEQQPDVRSLLEQLELKNPTVDVFVFDGEAKLLARSAGSAGAEQHAREIVRRIRVPDTLRVEDEPSGAGIFAVAPIRTRTSDVAHVVVIRPTDALHADLEVERRAELISIGALIAAISLVLWLVVRKRIHEPMSALIAGIRQFASGDMSARIHMKGQDEVAEIAGEFDAMAGALEESRRRLVTEAERREQLELDMQRANKLAIVGELAAMLAHEIGSPLQVLNGRARALLEHRGLAHDAKQSAAVLVEQTDRIDRIIQRLLGVARRQAPIIGDLSVPQTVRLLAELLSGEARRRGVRIEVECEDVPSIRADADQVQQVMLNLLQNALRACSRHGVVHVRVSCSSFKRPSNADDVPSVSVAIEDTGSGVPEEHRAPIFEPFFTAWENGPGPGGTGLGLSVVKSIMADHGGIVTVGARIGGVGAVFTVHFPLGATVPARARAEVS